MVRQLANHIAGLEFVPPRLFLRVGEGSAASLSTILLPNPDPHAYRGYYGHYSPWDNSQYGAYQEDCHHILATETSIREYTLVTSTEISGVHWPETKLTCFQYIIVTYLATSSELLKATSVDHNEMQDVSFVDVLLKNVCAVKNLPAKNMH